MSGGWKLKDFLWRSFDDSISRSPHGKRIEVLVGNDSSEAVPVEFAPASAPTVTNITTPGTANTEFSHALQTDVKKIMIRVRTQAQLSFNFITSFTDSITIPRGTTFTEDGVKLASTTIYFKCDKASQVVEILEWT